MMLQIEHRESHDVDIFLPDPQLLPFLDPRTHDFQLELQPADYDGDGSRFLKLAFKDVGEIDFIVGHAMTPSPTILREVENEATALETVAEIITKKIHYRGPSIKPRDIFDIAAAGVAHADSLVEVLRAYPQATATAIAKIDSLNPDFVNAAIAQLAIRDSYKEVASSAIARAQEILRAV